MGDDRRLTRSEFDEVIRRATELASREPDDEGELEESELYRIAREVGLPEEDVRTALREIRGRPRMERMPTGDGLLGRLVGPAVVESSRVVPGGIEELAESIDDYMVAGQLLQPIRRSTTLLQYRPAVDWVSQVARAASATSRRYYIASATSVEVRLDEVDGREDSEEGSRRSRVTIEVDPGLRGDAWGLAVVGTLVGGLALGGVTGFFLASLVPLVVAVVAGVAVASGVGVASVLIAGRQHREKMGDVLSEVEGVLDQMERGGELEPPPPSWRRWVERQFHGARRLLAGEERRPPKELGGGADRGPGDPG